MLRKLQIVLVVVVAAAFFLLLAKIHRQPASNSPSATSSPNKLTGLEIAKKIAVYFDKNMQPDGDINEYLCDSNSGCHQLTATPIEQTKIYNGFIAQGLYNLYQKTGDSHYNDDANKVMSYILANCLKDKTFCAGGLPGLYNWYIQTGDQKYKDAALRVGDSFLEDATANEILKRKNGRTGRSMWCLYYLTGDQRYKDLLVKTADNLMADNIDKTDTQYPFGPLFSYKEGAFEVKAYQIIAAGNIYLNAYKVTKNPIYLKAEQDFFDKAKFYLHPRDLDKIGLGVDAVLFLQELSEVSDSPKKEAYMDQSQILAQDALTNFWDSPENQKYTGDYGFINTSLMPSRKIAQQNGLRLLQFVDLPDQTFHLP